MLGETPYQIIESMARYAGYLVYEDETGALVLDRVGTKPHASGFSLPGNIESISAARIDGVISWSGISRWLASCIVGALVLHSACSCTPRR